MRTENEPGKPATVNTNRGLINYSAKRADNNQTQYFFPGNVKILGQNTNLNETTSTFEVSNLNITGAMQFSNDASGIVPEFTVPTNKFVPPLAIPNAPATTFQIATSWIMDFSNSLGGNPQDMRLYVKSRKTGEQKSVGVSSLQGQYNVGTFFANLDASEGFEVNYSIRNESEIQQGEWKIKVNTWSDYIVYTDPAPSPTATFSISTNNPKAGEAVTFTSTSQFATSFNWTFTPPGGAGSRVETGVITSNQQNPVITFPVSGTWTVQLRTNGPGGEATFNGTLQVEPASTGGGNQCNIPLCYVTQTVTSAAGSTITSTYTYTTVAGVKVLSKLSVNSGFVVTETNYEYNAQARLIRMETKATTFGFTNVVSSSTLEYNGQGQLIKTNDFDATGNLTGYTTTEYDGQGRRIKDTEFSASGVKEGETVYDEFDAFGNHQRQRDFDANGALISTTTLEYQNCQPIKVIGRNAAGNIVLDQTNTIGGNGMITTSVSIVTEAGQTITSNTSYTYDCN
jgi:PKD repeat protein